MDSLRLAERLDRSLAPGAVQVEDGEVRADVDVVELDSLGVSVRSVRVRGGRGGDVADQARRLPDALGVLGERVRAVEVDAMLGGAVLRSKPRRQEYFEVRSDGREVSVERLRRGPEGRARVPFTLTREQLGRLVDDVGGVIVGDDTD